MKTKLNLNEVQELVKNISEVRTNLTKIINLSNQLTKRGYRIEIKFEDLNNIHLTGTINKEKFTIKTFNNEGSPVFKVTFDKLKKVEFLPRTFSEVEYCIKFIRINK